MTQMIFRPIDCSCDYPTQVLSTGSGHRRDCPSHIRWFQNGKSWTPPKVTDGLEHTKEAQRIMQELVKEQANMTDWDRAFFTDLQDRFVEYGGRTFVSDGQIKVLRRMEESYLK